MTKAKPYEISKQLVWDAYKKVKANRGAAGVVHLAMTHIMLRRLTRPPKAQHQNENILAHIA